MKTYFWVIIAAVLIFGLGLFIKKTSASSSEHFVEFEFGGRTVRLNGKSDIHSEFYLKRWPDQHTPETIRRTNDDNQNVFCGRITNPDFSQMIEFHYTFPKGTQLKAEDLKKELNIKRYSAYSETEPYFRFWFLDTNVEYTTAIETDGYFMIRKIHELTDSTATAEGIFDFDMRQFGEDAETKVKGSFNLEFYIGL